MRACAERASTVRLSSLPKRSLLSPRPVGLVGCDDLGGALAGSRQRRPSRWASIAARNKTLASGSGVGVGSEWPLRARVYDVCIPAPPPQKKTKKKPWDVRNHTAPCSCSSSSQPITLAGVSSSISSFPAEQHHYYRQHWGKKPRDPQRRARRRRSGFPKDTQKESRNPSRNPRAG